MTNLFDLISRDPNIAADFKRQFETVFSPERKREVGNEERDCEREDKRRELIEKGEQR